VDTPEKPGMKFPAPMLGMVETRKKYHLAEQVEAGK